MSTKPGRRKDAFVVAVFNHCAAFVSDIIVPVAAKTYYLGSLVHVYVTSFMVIIISNGKFA